MVDDGGDEFLWIGFGIQRFDELDLECVDDGQVFIAISVEAGLSVGRCLSAVWCGCRSLLLLGL